MNEDHPQEYEPIEDLNHTLRPEIDQIRSRERPLIVTDNPPWSEWLTYGGEPQTIKELLYQAQTKEWQFRGPKALVLHKNTSVFRPLDPEETERLNEAIASLDTESLPTNTLLAILTISLPAKSKLPARKEFYHAVERLLHERGEFKDGLLSGLQ